MDTEGLLLCARYAASPNFFGYCGPRKSAVILDHLKEGVADSEMEHVLSEFETLHPYLQFIAREHGFPDPYDRRIVAAYWIGNALLRKVRSNDYAAFLREQLVLDKKISKEELRLIRDKTDKHTFLPHHAFHVFNIFKRTGKDDSNHTLNTMDECRIGWGTADAISGYAVRVLYKPLQWHEGKLGFGNEIVKAIHLDYKKSVFVRDIQKGDLVTFHWSQACEKITKAEVRQLDYYTKRAVMYYNEQ